MAACLMSPGVAVPIPVALSRRSAPRARAILSAAGARTILVSPGSEVPGWIHGEVGDQPTFVDVAQKPEPTLLPRLPNLPATTDLALIQFSSGSTGTPRGVALTHGNLATACNAIARSYGLDGDSRGVSWLPLHHDMGLVGHVLTPFAIGGRSTLMNPLRFMQRPIDWLRLVSDERATITSAPNFAYEMCARAASTADLGGIDLSSLSSAICGGEPVLESTAERFIAAFRPTGFSPAAFSPSYGLAEATLLVACGHTPTGPRFVSAEARAGDESPIAGRENKTVADLGRTVDGVTLRIVDANGRELPDGSVGEIEVSGPGVGRLVGSDGSLSEAGPILTGDLGFLRGGHVHIVGRRKEMIIIRGQNVYPNDVESAALEAHPSIVPGGIAALGVEVAGTEELIVLVEVAGPLQTRREAAEQVRRSVREVVAQNVGHIPADVVVLRPGALPRTSSGKVRRFEAAALLGSGELGGDGRPAAIAGSGAA
jgi:acyl-CoA synthetase (AMP-forming)/AMP-acid ligase II